MRCRFLDAEVVGTERRQVFDLPEIRLWVTEHVAQRRRCACGCETKAPFPAVATAPACYGGGVRALAAYLSVHQHLPYDRTAQLFKDVLGRGLVGALAQMVSEAAQGTAPFRTWPTCCGPLTRSTSTRRRPGGREVALGPRRFPPSS